MKIQIARIFNDLDVYRKFCVEFGYRYDEKDLYKDQSNCPYSQFLRYKSGKRITSQWRRDKHIDLR